MIVVTYGVNASGKDTLFKKTMSGSKDVVYLPASQILMKSAGILHEVNPNLTPTREEYRKLEDLDTNLRDELMETTFFDVLKEYSEKYKCVIVPMHLCIAKESGVHGDFLFDEPKIYSWIEKVDKVIYIRSPILAIENRIGVDSAVASRKRINIPFEVLREQMLRTERRWRDEIKKRFPPENVLIVNNHDGGIEKSLHKVLGFLRIAEQKKLDKKHERRMS
jgi:hypothetical protein